MALREVLYANDPKLRQKAKKIKKFGPHLKKLANDMLETMHHSSGVGLAGPQIGLMQRIFVAEIPKNEEDPQSGKPFVLINPQVTKCSSEIVEGQEGCLSIPGWAGLVDRPTWVEIRYKTVNGKTVRLRADGLLARVILHEYDHLEGILFIDYITDKEKLWEVKDEEEDDEGKAKEGDGEQAKDENK